MNQTILTAIHARRLLSIEWHQNLRVVEPYLYGADDCGVEKICAWQVVGASHEEPGWRWFDLREITMLTWLPDCFSDERLLGCQQNCPLSSVYAQLFQDSLCHR
ncbi:MAG: hypothetical protein JNM52_05635 [Betaproteobacteria bacterium]|nr:hypothetical protein [Betaproteobacteria bacterium]